MRIKIITLYLIIISVLGSCSTTTFIDDGNGHKQYKDKNGNVVKSEWVHLNGKYYYFDRNGYLATNQWIDDEYFVDENGVMKTNYWYEGETGYYYLDNEGKYLRNNIMEIDGNIYAFDLNGINIKNAPYVVNGEGYYFGNDGKADKIEGWKNFLDTYCYVKEDGKLLISDWKEDGNKKYYLNEAGLMVKNSFVDGNYYVDENGEMAKNKKLKLGNSTYNFDNDGMVAEKRINKDFVYKIGKAYWGKVITNDSDNKYYLKCINGNGKEKKMYLYVYQFGIEFRYNPSKSYQEFEELYQKNIEKRETFLETENGERIKIYYWSPKTYSDVFFGIKTVARQSDLSTEEKNSYKELISLLCKDTDTKFTVYIPELNETVSSEINVGNFNSVYSQVSDKEMW